MCKCWFRALHLFLYSLAVYSPLSDSSDAALSPLVYRAPSAVARVCADSEKGHRARSLGLSVSLARAARPAGVRVGPEWECGAACVWLHVGVWRRN